MKTIGLISCTSKKRDKRCQASKLYSASALFSKAYAYSRKNYDQIAILSAKYGLVFPEDVIDPYDLTLNEMSAEEIRNWSKKVFEQMHKRFDLNDVSAIFFHAGAKYRKYLIPKLKETCVDCFVPLEGLRIGEQLAWYDEHDC